MKNKNLSYTMDHNLKLVMQTDENQFNEYEQNEKRTAYLKNKFKVVIKLFINRLYILLNNCYH